MSEKIRDSFIFYRSFYQSAKKLPKEDKAELFDAICSYALDGELVELSVVPEAIFTVIKPNLDANRRKWENGCKEKKKPSEVEAIEEQEISKDEANDKQTISKAQGNVDVNVYANVDEECKLKSKSESKRFTSPTLQEITIPDFIDASLWNSFLEMRVSKKAKPTQKAIELIIKELTKFHNKGLNANESLENSIKSNWTGVFEPRNNNQSQFLTTDQKRRQNNLNASAEFLRLTSGDDNAGQ